MNMKLMVLVLLLTSADSFAAPDPGVVGKWSGVIQYPIIPIHAATMPDGRILFWDSTTDDLETGYYSDDQPSTRVVSLDPAAGKFVRVDSRTDSNIFCAGHAHLPNGDLFAAGGNISGGKGIKAVNIFRWGSKKWERSTDTFYTHWYPGVTQFSNGKEMLITSGGADIPEIFTIATGDIRELPGARLTLRLYPWQFPAPNGKVFHAGPDPQLRYLNTAGNGAWQKLIARDKSFRGYGSYAIYQVDGNGAKILVAGGGSSLKSAVVITLTPSGSASVKATGNMNIGRRQHNLTVLPDGSVVATGGNKSGVTLVDLDNGVFEAEIWNPSTGKWTLLSRMKITRQYHSLALLTRDGRIWSAGGGLCVDCDPVKYHHKNGEYFSPPYLFKKDGSGQFAPRPTISGAPAGVAYGKTFTVQSPQAASIGSIALVQLSSATHSQNAGQRRIPLAFSVVDGTLRVVAPKNANIAPRGYYYLYILNGGGVPSGGRSIRIG